MFKTSRVSEKGDTLIEVLFAFAVLSLVIVGALTLMNQGTLASQRSLEITLVREEIDGQATTLRFLHDAYVAQFQPNETYAANTPAGQWATMVSQLSATSSTSFGGVTSCPTPPSGSFVLDPVTATYQGVGAKLAPSTTFAQLVYNSSNVLTASDGVWVEGIKSTDVQTDPNKQNVTYIDFHINACWDAPGSGPPMTIGTIVRLYEPLN
jgi:type II secretory pathway pseudopilin PulG